MNQDLELQKSIEKMNERFKEKKKEDVLEKVPAEFLDKVNEALDLEMDEEYEQVVNICKEILATDEGKDVEQVKILLARVYPELLKTDVYAANKKYQSDVDEYFEFLDGITMNDLMQEYVVETLIKLCGLMENEWFRPLFKNFIEKIDEKNYLTEEIYKNTLQSAYSSLESSMYFEDARLSVITKNALKSGYDRSYAFEGLESEEAKNVLMLNILTNDYYVCRYYEENKQEYIIAEKEYPHSYSLIKEMINEVESNQEKKIDETLDELMKYVSKGIDKDALKVAMDKAYEDVSKRMKEPQLAHSGKGTYKRFGEKIGRNDNCPCGSGKKYKNCCGK